MASAVAGFAMSGFGPSSNHFDIFGSAAQAGVGNAVSSATQPIGFADTVERVKPSVISVKVTMKDKATNANAKDEDGEPGSPMERFFRRFGPNGGPQNPGRKVGHGEMMGQGSGFFISSDGYAVTNNHVVEGAEKVEVTTDAGKTYTAKLIGTDPRTDVALIKVEGRSDFPSAKLSDGNARIGDWVLAVGNPFGLGGTVTAGIVSASGRDIGNGPYDDFIQIDAPVNKGNSGGPAFNMQGEVVGVNTAIYSPSGGFAPGTIAKLDVLHKGRSKVVSLTLGQLPNAQEAKVDVEADGKGSIHGTDVPRLGLTVAPAGKVDGAGKEGVVITKVEPKSAAADRGLKKGDV